MDPAETLREVLRKQKYVHRKYEDAKRREPSPEQSPEQWSEHLQELRDAVDAADQEMDRLRPKRPAPEATEDEYVPPMSPGMSN
jgi:uncharacterized membrane protein YccC